jgi:hypothetical protein
MPRNFLSLSPIPAKAKKLGLLSIYTFSLISPFSDFTETGGHKEMSSILADQ